MACLFRISIIKSTVLYCVVELNVSMFLCSSAGSPLAEIANIGMKALKMQKLRVRHFMSRSVFGGPAQGGSS